jgi:O-acetyl-ADP-ribose deacetylase (regulator of RNase III)
MLHFRTGNLLHSTMQTLVNPVNTVGAMGKGVALQFRKKYPAMYAEYETLCKQGALRIGNLHLYRADDHWILNFPTKRHYRMPSRLEDIETGLTVLCAQYATWGIDSLALPALGCGYGGLSWSDVKPLIQYHLDDLPIPIEVYQPREVEEQQSDHVNDPSTANDLTSAGSDTIQPGLFDDLDK